MLCLGWFPSVSTYANEAIKQAWQEIEKKNYSNAITILQRYQQKNPSNPRAQYLLARTHSWNGDYHSAIQLLDRLLKKEPQNSDFLLTKARILSWQNNNTEAIKLLNIARNISPNYFDVWDLELKLMQREFSNKEQTKISTFYNRFKSQFPHKSIPLPVVSKIKKKRFVATTAQIEKLDNDLDSWKKADIAYGNQWKKYNYVTKLAFDHRFGLSDQEFQLSIYRKTKQHLWLSGGASFSNRQLLYPSFSVNVKADYLTTTKWLLSYQLDHRIYQNLVVDNSRIAISRRWGNFQPACILYITGIDYNETTLSGTMQLSYYFRNKGTVRISATKGRQLEYIDKTSKIHDTTNITLDGSYQLNPTWLLISALNYHSQGTAYKKYGILSGLQYRF